MHTAQINAVPSRSASIQARDILFFTLIGVSVLIWWRQIVTLLQLAWHVDEYTHILLIMPVSVALIYLERGKLRRNITYAPVTGAVVGLLSIAIGIVGKMQAVHFGGDVSLINHNLFAGDILDGVYCLLLWKGFFWIFIVPILVSVSLSASSGVPAR